ncbi:hypothetical protein JSE7799_01325 [Jannaschia seosinensis]|uniref:Uncharacterized protein n=1 Tax=Jannaschia seosinensis TaxID=313367 RepID=A0A0M7B8T1_9RHOB|nr:hypothetical protein [Jannaschia seosinensis]CUH37769.1 hypothetical protein JSE7799_01325 [Jannaschia seosinensis]
MIIAHLLIGFVAAVLTAGFGLLAGAGWLAALGLYVLAGSLGTLASALLLAWRMARGDGEHDASHGSIQLIPVSEPEHT